MWLRQQRREAGITRDSLADQVACSTETLQKIEAGERRPSRQIALSLAALFGVPADEQEAFVTFARTLSPRDAISPEQEEAHAQEHSPWRAVHLSKSNLPLVLTTLIGRERELDEVCSRLMQPKARLLTITGSPGTGKTRMAIEVAATLLGDFEDGVYLAELAPMSDPAMVIPSIASALDLRETGTQPLEETLLRYIKDKRILLVLDNFEHLLDAGPHVVKLIQASPWLKVLITSREALHVRGERQYPLPPLSLPVLRDRLNLEELARNPAVQLFAERAQSVDAGFALTEENALEVAEVCVHLNGLPLAIELAAGRVSLFPPRILLSKLGQQLKVLTGGSRDLPPRQRTLRGAIKWSYDLLDEGHRELFRRMAVFSGGWTLQGLEAVCNSASLQVEGKERKVEVVDGVETLVSANLLQQREGSDGEPRLWMLETIHEYASEKMQESGEAQALQREHALYFMRLVEEAEPHLRGGQQQEWLQRVEDEYANITAALAWTREQSQGGSQAGAEIGLRTAGAIWRFWYVKGLFSEGRKQVERALSVPKVVLQACSPDSRSKVLNAAGALAYRQGDYFSARSLSEEALVLGREIADKQSMSVSLNVLGSAAWEQGDYTRARALHEESLALRRELGDKSGISFSLNNLGIVAYQQGDYTWARALYEECLALKWELGDKWSIASSLSNLGLVVQEQGDYTRAHALYEESLALKREIGDKQGITLSLTNLGTWAQAQGDYTEARALYEESLMLRREIGDKWGIGYSLTNLGTLAQAQRDYTEAHALYEESLMLRREIGDKWGIAVTLAGLGGVAIGVGQEEQVERGAKLLGAVEGLLQSLGTVLYSVDRLPYESAMASARSGLGEEAFEKAWQEGRGMSLEEAVDCALEAVNKDQ